MNAYLSQRSYAQQSGVSLIELMIAMVISLLLLTGVIQIFVSSKQTYTAQEGVSRVQESGRFTINYVARFVRMGGFQGCTNVNLLRPNIISQTVPANYFAALNNVVTGINDASGSEGTPAYNARPGTDIVTIHSGSPSTVKLDGNLSADNANIQIDGNPDGFQAGDVLFITDCEYADIFTATNVSSGSGKSTIAHANSVNTSNRLSRAYRDDAVIMRLQATSFFVRQTPTLNANGAPIFGLFQRNELNGAETLLVDGVEDFQVMYGVDTAGGDRIADVYQTANNVVDWTRVVSLRMSLLVNSVENFTDGQLPYQFMGNVINNPGDRLLRREFTATVGIRNRML